MRAFVTGGTGFIGGRMVERLLDDGWDVSALVRSPERGARIRRIRHDRLFDLLVGLPGVGPKTAACVLLFSLDRPYFPVDTHVHRVAMRLGLVPPMASPAQTQERLQAALAADEMYDAHMNLIRHGRHVCVALRPICSQCVLNDLCPKVGVTRSR